MEIIEDLKQCEQLWNEHSPKNVLWDEWFIVKSFYNPQIHTPYFMKTKEGVLPLWHNAAEKIYEFFGGDFPEDRIFWFDPKHFQAFIDSAPRPLCLFDIKKEAAEALMAKYPGAAPHFTCGHYDYSLDISEMHSFQDFLARFGSKHKKNFARDIKAIEQMGLTIEWNGFSFFDKMIEFNIRRFGSESDFIDPEYARQFRSLLTALNEKGLLHGLLLRKQEEIVGVYYSAYFKGVYYLLNGGSNPSILNLGKYLVCSNIRRAFELGASKIDLLSGEENTWKNMWHFDRRPYYAIVKKESGESNSR